MGIIYDALRQHYDNQMLMQDAARFDWQVLEADKPRLGPCQMHGVINDAEEWAEFEKARKAMAQQQLVQEVLDHAAQLKKDAERLMRLVGRL